MKLLTNAIWGLLEVQIIDSIQHQYNEYMPLHCFNSLIGVATINTVRLSTSPSNLPLVQALKNITLISILQVGIHSSHSSDVICFVFLSLLERLILKI